MKHVRSRFLLAFLLVFVSQALAQMAAPRPSSSAEGDTSALITYSLSLRDPGSHSVHVSIGVDECNVADRELPPPAETQPSCNMQLPVWNALYQVRDFAQYVRNVTAKDLQGNPLVVRALDKTTWQVSQDRSPFDFEYDVLAENPGPFGAQLSDTHAFFNLAELLMYPVRQRTARVAIRFTDLPAGWRIATALPHFMDNSFLAENYDQLADSPVEIGDFAESDFEDGATRYRVVVDANPSDYDMNAIAQMARKLAATEIEWMQDRPIDHYLFIYHFPRRPAGGGMEHAFSTAIDAPAERVKANPLSLADVTAHEFFHLWNVKRIRPQSLEPVDYTREQYTRALWFSEGVTSSVADYMRVCAGYLDEAGYLVELALGIRRLEARPAHLTQSVEESSLDAWLEKYSYYDQPERSISYYNKGEIVGVLLDLQMREASAGKKSLRDLFHWMNQHYAKQGKFFPDSAGVRHAAEVLTGADFGDFFARYVAGVDPIPYDRFFATVGLRLDKRTALVADPGFRVSARFGQAAIVTSLEANSEAAKAGLKPGDIVLEIDGRPVVRTVDAAVEFLRPGDSVRLKVSGSHGERELKFKLGSRPIDDYALVEAEGATPAQRARRSAWMRGDSEVRN